MWPVSFSVRLALVNGVQLAAVVTANLSHIKLRSVYKLSHVTIVFGCLLSPAIQATKDRQMQSIFLALFIIEKL